MNAETCLVTGASSQLGDALLPLLVANGSRVVAWSRQPQESSNAVCWKTIDLNRTTEIPETVKQLVHLAPITLLLPLLQQPLPPLRIIAISTCSIRYKAQSECSQERQMAQTLLQAEQAVIQHAQAAGHQLTVLRPSMLYGLGRDGTVAVMQRFAQRFGFLLVPAGADGLRQPVHVGDVAQAIIQCLAQPATQGKRYELGGAEQLTVRELAQRVLQENQRTQRVITVPSLLLRLLITLARLSGVRPDWNTALLARARQTQVVDNSAAQHDFGYTPRAFDGRLSQVREAVK